MDRYRWLWHTAAILLGLATHWVAPRAAFPTSVRFADVVSITGAQIARFNGVPINQLAVLACAERSGRRACDPIPFQIDERDADGQWVLDHGPQPNVDDPPGVLDANDELLFMASDAADRGSRADVAAKAPIEEISVSDPLSRTTRWAYVVFAADVATSAARSYVAYQPVADRVRGQRVTLGFRHGVPGYLALNQSAAAAGAASGDGLLDRFKVRATATFLFGLIHFSRDEDDVTSEFVAWREGPIRVIRRQRQWVRIGWGIRSPTFGSYTYFYRDFAELPVGLYLNFPPTYFFGDIVIRAFLDFRDLRGWSLVVPGLGTPIPIDGVMTPRKRRVNDIRASWFALCGPDVTLVQLLDVGPSLSTVRRRLFYRESGDTSEPPEAVPGELPGVGYRLDQWDDVGAGRHQLTSVSYALPADLDVRQFMQARRVPLRVAVHDRP